MKLTSSLYCVILSILQWNQWEIVDLGYIGKFSMRSNECHILLCIIRLVRLAVLSAVRKWKSGVVYYTWFEVAWLIKLRTFLKGRLKLYSDFVLQISCFIAILLWLYRFLLVWKVSPRVGVEISGQRCSSRYLVLQVSIHWAIGIVNSFTLHLSPKFSGACVSV